MIIRICVEPFLTAIAHEDPRGSSVVGSMMGLGIGSKIGVASTQPLEDHSDWHRINSMESQVCREDWLASELLGLVSQRQS